MSSLQLVLLSAVLSLLLFSLHSVCAAHHSSSPMAQSLPFKLIRMQEHFQGAKVFATPQKDVSYSLQTGPKLFLSKPSEEPLHPIWPLQFNCTLAKITPFNHDIQWTKLYYDYKNKLGRFDFFDNYYDMDNSWGSINMTILWIGNVVWYVYPKVKQCSLRSKNLPLISPDWLKMTNYVGRTLFREMYSDVWQFPNVDELDGMRYYHRVGNSSETKTPLRSTNQINDPGATDYFDFTVGPSHFSLYQVPVYCKDDIFNH